MEFVADGGLNTRGETRYSFRACPEIKVVITFVLDKTMDKTAVNFAERSPATRTLFKIWTISCQVPRCRLFALKAEIASIYALFFYLSTVDDTLIQAIASRMHYPPQQSRCDRYGGKNDQG